MVSDDFHVRKAMPTLADIDFDSFRVSAAPCPIGQERPALELERTATGRRDRILTHIPRPGESNHVAALALL
jgi:hypothetical protein